MAENLTNQNGEQIMSKDLNRCDFIGRIGRDLEIKYTNSGQPIANISLACSDDYKDKQTGNKVERTEWIRIVAFGNLAEIMGKYLTKGSQVYISGKMTTRKWKDKEGNDRYTTEIIANEMQMLGGGSNASQDRPEKSRKENSYGNNHDEFGEIPF